MKLDSEGRISLGKELCEDFNYSLGSTVAFVYEGNNTYRLAKGKTDLDVKDRVSGYSNIEPDKFRIYIPIEIRDCYTSHVRIYGITENEHIYVEFLGTVEDSKLVETLNALTKAIEKNYCR